MDRAGRTYFQVKQTASDFQLAKHALMGEGRPFAGWLRSGKEWESFDVDGELHLAEEETY
jgi:tRNA-specific adenosine deaminase 1